MNGEPAQVGPVNVATAIILPVYVVLFALFLRSVGFSMFRDLSPDGRAFWFVQGGLLLALIATSFPITSRLRTWYALPRLVIVASLFISFLLAAGLSDGFRY